MSSCMTPLTESESSRAGHPAMTSLLVRSVIGEAIGPHLGDIALLRAVVLREWPYLFDDRGDDGNDHGRSGNADAAVDHGTDPEDPGDAGNLAQLPGCVDSWRAVAVLVSDGDRLVGASVGLPLADAGMRWREGFAAAGLKADRVFLLGESMLLPAYRGRGLGHRFFDERESQARALGGFDSTAFCIVERADDDPRRPPFGRSNDAFWRKRGYRPCQALDVACSWVEVNGGSSVHRLAGWLRPLERTL